MELLEYWSIVRRWWWLLLLCTLLAGGGAYLVSIRMAPNYESSTLLMIGSSLDVVNPTTGEMQTSEKLAQTYAELIKTRPVVDATMANLGLAHDPSVSVTLVRNTQLMRVTVSDSSPARAAATADELANQLILQSPSAPQREEQSYREFVKSQLADLETEIAEITDAIATAESTGDSNQVVRLQSEVNARRENYSNLLTYLKGSSINFISVIEPARVPTTPTSPKVPQNTLLAALVGLMLAAGAAFLIEYLDMSVKGPLDIEQKLELPILGTITDIAPGDDSPGLIAKAKPTSPISEAYRMVHFNVRFSLEAGVRDRRFLITSPGSSEGKSTTASNLAITMAGAGQKVILVDADLRRPSQHRVYGRSNQVGLSSLLVGEVEALADALVPTEIDGLRLLPSGPIPPNAAELLSSRRMIDILDQLSAEADVVLLDSTPILAVADASILAGVVTGTIMVVEPSHTHLAACARGAEMIRKAGGTLLGVVLNRQKMRRQGYYGSYGYYYGAYGYYYGGYEYTESGEEGAKTRKRVHKHKNPKPQTQA
ncbi:MAG: tyrosine-protein kinase domain-containing protein [Anaerolineae bacterium]